MDRCCLILIHFFLIILFPMAGSATESLITFDECSIGTKPYMEYYWYDCPAMKAKNVWLAPPDKVIKENDNPKNQVLDSGGELRVEFRKGLNYYSVRKFSILLKDLPAHGTVRYTYRNSKFQFPSPGFYVSGPGDKTITLTGDIVEVVIDNTYIGDPWYGVVDDMRFDDSDSSTVTSHNVSFAIFIPANNLTGGPSEQCRFRTKLRQEYYKGDNRNFNPSGTSARGRQVFTVLPDTASDLDGIQNGSIKTVVGQSRGYAEDALLDKKITAKDDDRTLNDCALLHETGIASSDKMNIRGQRTGPKSVTITMQGSLGNPLILTSGLCCTADWDLRLSIDATSLPARWSLAGKHDGFPAYEIYIDGNPIYTYSPGAVPYSFDKQIKKLLPPMDITIPMRSGFIK